MKRLSELNLTRHAGLAPYANRLSQHAAAIEAAAAKHGVAPFLVAAITIVESGVQAGVSNDFHAVGLMQVVSSGNPNPVFKGRPTTAQLKDPATNLHWGCSILAHNIKAAGGDEQRALYNYSGGGAWPSFDNYVARYWNKVQTYRQALESLASEESAVNTIQLFWPTQYKTVTQAFGANPATYRKWDLPGHEGVDIRAPHGSNIFACHDGVVKLVRTNPVGHNYGIHVRIVSHDGSYETIYAHFHQALVREGQRVKWGQVIGIADSTGNSSGSHLHLTLKIKGATARRETKYPNDQVDPKPYLLPFGVQPTPAKVLPPIQRPNFPLRGLHGDGAAEYALATGFKGTVVEVVYSHGDLNTPRPVDYSAYEAAGIRVIVRWNYSWAKADGGLGTFPVRALYQAFRRWLYESIRQSKGVHLHIIGNETNRAAERPDYQDEQNPGTAITPADVLAVYNPVWKALPTGVRLSPPAIDPTNNQSGDPLQYQKEILVGLAGAEGFALHGYSYRSDQAVNTDERFASMRWQVYGFRMWEALAQAIYDYERDGQPIFRRLPLYITETNHLFRRDGNLGWDEDATGWIVEAGRYVAWWNAQPGEQFVHALCFYRFRGDAWTLEHYPALLDAVRSVA
jgi:hypothetical protein